MSTVAAVVDNRKVWMGSDSFATTEQGERRNIKAIKLFINGPYMFGFIGSVRVGQLLKPEYFKAPSRLHEFPDEIYNHLEPRGCIATNSETQTSYQESNILIATRDGQLFEILSDLQMNEIEDYSAIGSGAQFALGSLYSTRNTLENRPEMRIQMALRCASFFDTSTGEPFVIQAYPRIR